MIPFSTLGPLNQKTLSCSKEPICPIGDIAPLEEINIPDPDRPFKPCIEEPVGALESLEIKAKEAIPRFHYFMNTESTGSTGSATSLNTPPSTKSRSLETASRSFNALYLPKLYKRIEKYIEELKAPYEHTISYNEKLHIIFMTHDATGSTAQLALFTNGDGKVQPVLFFHGASSATQYWDVAKQLLCVGEPVCLLAASKLTGVVKQFLKDDAAFLENENKFLKKEKIFQTKCATELQKESDYRTERNNFQARHEALIEQEKEFSEQWDNCMAAGSKVLEASKKDLETARGYLDAENKILNNKREVLRNEFEIFINEARSHLKDKMSWETLATYNSNVPPENPSITAFNPLILMGHSYGGAKAQYAAATNDVQSCFSVNSLQFGPNRSRVIQASIDQERTEIILLNQKGDFATKSWIIRFISWVARCFTGRYPVSFGKEKKFKEGCHLGGAIGIGNVKERKYLSENPNAAEKEAARLGWKEWRYGKKEYVRFPAPREKVVEISAEKANHSPFIPNISSAN